MKVKLFWAWYDFWVGFFWDSKKRIMIEKKKPPIKPCSLHGILAINVDGYCDICLEGCK